MLFCRPTLCGTAVFGANHSGNESLGHAQDRCYHLYEPVRSADNLRTDSFKNAVLLLSNNISFFKQQLTKNLYMQRISYQKEFIVRTLYLIYIALRPDNITDLYSRFNPENLFQVHPEANR